MESGDSDAKACDLLPTMNVMSFSATPKSGEDGVPPEPIDRAPSSGIETATVPLAMRIEAADRTTAGHIREALAVDNDSAVGAETWGTSQDWAAAIIGAGVQHLREIRAAA